MTHLGGTKDTPYKKGILLKRGASVRILESGHLSQRLQDMMDVGNLCGPEKKYNGTFVIELETVPIQSF